MGEKKIHLINTKKNHVCLNVSVKRETLPYKESTNIEKNNESITVEIPSKNTSFNPLKTGDVDDMVVNCSLSTYYYQ